MSPFKVEHKKSPSQWHATKYATLVYWKVKTGLEEGAGGGVLQSSGLLAYIKAPHWEHGGLFGGEPPRYILFDPPLKS